MRAFLRTQHGKLAGTLLALFVIAVTLRLHGFSLPIWHRFVDFSVPTEVLAGELRDIRSDDWLLELPIALGQLRNGFAEVNPDIGLGQNIALPFRTPVRGPLELFRPYTWGFFLGPETGLAWLWWMSELGLFYALFLALCVVAPGRFWAPLLAAAGIVASPCLQFWSFQNSEPYAHGALTFACLAALLRARRLRAALGVGALLGWAAACAVLENLYPPAIVGSVWLFGALAVALLVETRAWLRENRLLVAAGSLVAGAVLAIAFWSMREAASGALELIAQTTYPGQRTSLGGEKPLWTFFVDHFFVSRLPEALAGSLRNICEAGSFLFYFPVVLCVLVACARFDGVIAACAVVIAVQGWFCVRGVSPLFAQVSLLSHSQPWRPVVSIGLASAVMVLRFVVQRERFRIGPVRQLAIGALLLAGLVAEALAVHRAMPQNTGLFLTGAILLQLGLCALLLVPRLTPFFLAAQLAVLAPYTLGFNPLVRGGVRTLEQTPLATKMRELQAGAPQSRWAVFGDDNPFGYALILGNFPRLIGIPALNGYQCPPQLATWRALGLETPRLNICGYFSMTPTTGPAHVEDVGAGRAQIWIDPAALRPLGVRYALVAGAPALFVSFSSFTLVADLDVLRIYDLGR